MRLVGHRLADRPVRLRFAGVMRLRCWLGDALLDTEPGLTLTKPLACIPPPGRLPEALMATPASRFKRTGR